MMEAQVEDPALLLTFWGHLLGNSGIDWFFNIRDVVTPLDDAFPGREMWVQISEDELDGLTALGNEFLIETSFQLWGGTTGSGAGIDESKRGRVGKVLNQEITGLGGWGAFAAGVGLPHLGKGGVGVLAEPAGAP